MKKNLLEHLKNMEVTYNDLEVKSKFKKESNIVKIVQKLAKQGENDIGPLAKEVFNLWKKKLRKTKEESSNGKDKSGKESKSSSASSMKNKQEKSDNQKATKSGKSIYESIRESVKELSDNKRNNFRNLFFEALCWKDGKIVIDNEKNFEQEFLLNIKDIAASIEESTSM